MIKTKTIYNRQLRRKNLLSRVRRVLVLIQVAIKNGFKLYRFKAGFQDVQKRK